MFFWSDEGKSPREIKRRNTILGIMGVARGWLFVEYVDFEGKGYCEVTNANIKTGIKVTNPENNKTFIVAEAVAIKYVDDVVIPRKTQENTVSSRPNKKMLPEPKIPQKRGPKPKQKVTLDIEPGLKFIPDYSEYNWNPQKE